MFGGYVESVDGAVKTRHIVSVFPTDRLAVDESLRRGLVVRDVPWSGAWVTLY